MAVHAAIACGLGYVSFADLLWVETFTPDLAEATKFAEAIHPKFPGKTRLHLHMQELIC